MRNVIARAGGSEPLGGPKRYCRGDTAAKSFRDILFWTLSENTGSDCRLFSERFGVKGKRHSQKEISLSIEGLTG